MTTLGVVSELRCAKCNGDKITVRWHAGGRYGESGCGYHAKVVESSEHMHHTCESCLYEWTGLAGEFDPSGSERARDSANSAGDSFAVVPAEGASTFRDGYLAAAGADARGVGACATVSSGFRCHWSRVLIRQAEEDAPPEAKQGHMDRPYGV